MSKQLEVNCPTCSKKVIWCSDSAFRPFCSERCQQIDLGAWASEAYGIPSEIKDEWELAEHQTQLEEALISRLNEPKH
jgi:endogenous inhibitor of DNA gyrase (YacG/DUF329 family)